MTTQRWTLADIKRANIEAGEFFFERSTMKFFGDTMRSFVVRHIAEQVYVERIAPMRDTSGRSIGGVGERRRFNAITGTLGPIILPD